MRKISEALDQYTGICKEAIVDSAAKLGKSFEKVIIEILLLYMVVPGKINLSAVISKPCSKRKCSDLQSIYSMPDSRKGLPSISIMLSGSVKLFSEVHPQRKLEGICLIVFGIFIFSNELQKEKLLSANCSTLSGISTDLSDLQPENVLSVDNQQLPR